MSGVEKFEDLIAGQKARELTRRIYEVTMVGEVARDFRLASQMQAASVSIISNIAEGFERHSASEFHQVLKVANASCVEVRSQLYVALDAKYTDRVVIAGLRERAEEVGRVTGGLRASVGRSRDAGK